MTELPLPPLMGLFCTGYVLHRAWWFWYQRRLVKQIYRMQVMFEIERLQDIIWKDWDITEPPSEVRRAA